MQRTIRSIAARITLAAYLPAILLPACAQTEESVESDTVSIEAFDADGNLAYEEQTTAEAVRLAIEGLPSLTVDGVVTDDMSKLFTGRLISLPTPKGGEIEFLRQGNRLFRVDPGDAVGLAVSSVEWNSSHDRITVHTPKGDLVNTITGLEPSLARDFTGYLAIASLDPYAEIDSQPYHRAAGAVIVTLAAIGVVGYLGCLALGPGLCQDAANAGCGQGNVEDYKVICGAGTDLDGNFQIGFFCSYKCKPAAAPAPVLQQKEAADIGGGDFGGGDW